ncbi:MAG: hypothetical protein Q9159_000321 [Coniocarpon cinnabarinum]
MECDDHSSSACANQYLLEGLLAHAGDRLAKDIDLSSSEQPSIGVWHETLDYLIRLANFSSRISKAQVQEYDSSINFTRSDMLINHVHYKDQQYYRLFVCQVLQDRARLGQSKEGSPSVKRILTDMVTLMGLEVSMRLIEPGIREDEFEDLAVLHNRLNGSFEHLGLVRRWICPGPSGKAPVECEEQQEVRRPSTSSGLSVL